MCRWIIRQLRLRWVSADQYIRPVGNGLNHDQFVIPQRRQSFITPLSILPPIITWHQGERPLSILQVKGRGEYAPFPYIKMSTARQFQLLVEPF